MADHRPDDRSRPAADRASGIRSPLIKLSRADWIDDVPGDSACWAHRVCVQCGCFSEDEHPQVCDACGAAFD